MSEHRGLEPIGGDVEALLDRLGMPAALDMGTLAEDWDEIAGPEFASRCSPVGLGDGELVVEVPDGPAASLLKYRMGHLLDRLDDRFGEGTVDRIRIRVGNRKNTL